MNIKNEISFIELQKVERQSNWRKYCENQAKK